MVLLALITAPDTVAKILEHLHVPSTAGGYTTHLPKVFLRGGKATCYKAVAIFPDGIKTVRFYFENQKLFGWRAKGTKRLIFESLSAACRDQWPARAALRVLAVDSSGNRRKVFPIAFQIYRKRMGSGKLGSALSTSKTTRGKRYPRLGRTRS